MNLILAIGSNYGDRAANIERALEVIRNLSKEEEVSSIYESPDCLGVGRNYLNAVARITVDETELNALTARFKRLEAECGRTPEASARGEVCLDIDVVISDGKILRPADFRSFYFRKGYKEMRMVTVEDL